MSPNPKFGGSLGGYPLITEAYFFHFIFSRLLIFRTPMARNDAPDDSVVVVQYASSSSHISARIVDPSSPRFIVFFHRSTTFDQKC